MKIKNLLAVATLAALSTLAGSMNLIVQARDFSTAGTAVSMATGSWTNASGSAAAVSITRDDWGIAHVRGHTDADAVFGMVYAQAEDDFNRVETNFITNLGRIGNPLIRYRTGDLVTVSTQPDPSGRVLRWLQGGILGRVDDMLIIRGNNLFPGSIEAIIREFPAITEFRLEVSTVQGMRDLSVAVETGDLSGPAREQLVEQLRTTLRQRLGFSAGVRTAESGSLPRSEMKSRRVVLLD